MPCKRRPPLSRRATFDWRFGRLAIQIPRAALDCFVAALLSMTDLYDREPVLAKNELLIQLDARFLDDRFQFDGIGLDNRGVGIRSRLAKARAQLGKGS
jgi:hypothetical protein